MTYSTVIYEKTNKYAVLKLNRPERMNAVIEEMYNEIKDVLKKASQDPDVRALILTGVQFEKDGKLKQAFCAGADMKKHASGERSTSQKREYIMLAHETTQKIYEFTKPIIAVVNGPARGAGAEMALNCDFLFMANDATISFPETGIGTCIGGGSSSHLTRMIGLQRAKELIFTGKVINGQTALEMGLALKAFPITGLYDEAVKFAEILSSKAPVSMHLAKKLVQDSTITDIESVLYSESKAILQCMGTEDWHEGARAFAEKRIPDYKGK